MCRSTTVALFVAVAIVAIYVIATRGGPGSGFVAGMANAPTPGPAPAPKGGPLYDRLGGAFPIAAVVDRFSDEILKSPLVGVNSPNPALREWSRNEAGGRLPGLKFLRALWVADVAGGPQKFGGTHPEPSRLNLSAAHARLHITSAEFDEVARILGATLDEFKVPAAEKAEVLGAFAAHKSEVVGGAAHKKEGLHGPAVCKAETMHEVDNLKHYVEGLMSEMPSTGRCPFAG